MKEGTGSIGVDTAEGVVEGASVEVTAGVESCGGTLELGDGAGPHPAAVASNKAKSTTKKPSSA